MLDITYSLTALTNMLTTVRQNVLRTSQFFAWFLVLLVALHTIVGYAQESANLGQVQFKSSDNRQYFSQAEPDWSMPTIQSDSWIEFDRELRKQSLSGIYWLSFDVYLTEGAVPLFDWEYNLNMLAAQEVYWDGQLLGYNGMPAVNKADEIPGQMWTTYLVPNHLFTPGKHVITIKASSHYRKKGMKVIKEGWLQPFDAQFRFVSLGSLIPSLLVSISAVVGLYFLMLFFTEGKQWEHLIFFLLLENITLYGFAIQWDHLVGYTYDWEWLNLTLEMCSSIAILLLFPCYFLFKHRAENKMLWLCIAIFVTYVTSKILPNYEPYVAWFGSLATALIVSIYYGFIHKKHLWWESLGLALCLIGIVNEDLEDVYFYFPALFILVLLSQAIAMQQRKNALQLASHVESQLRAELLRKHIQPHFLLNTLTSLMEWVETDVERSTEFIAELADEFRLMSSISSAQLIDVKTELTLCEKHLAIMSLRLQKQCSLVCKNIVEDEQIPPAIFHTLIENAFSHNVYQQDELIFTIERHLLASGYVKFDITVPRNEQQESAFSKLGTGTGKKYIEARLSQSFTSHWLLTEKSNDNTWQTSITLDYRHLNKLVLEEIL